MVRTMPLARQHSQTHVHTHRGAYDNKTVPGSKPYDNGIELTVSARAPKCLLKTYVIPGASRSTSAVVDLLAVQRVNSHKNACVYTTSILLVSLAVMEISQLSLVFPRVCGLRTGPYRMRKLRCSPELMLK